MSKLISVVGARPNFMKIAPFIKTIEDYNSLNRNKPIKHILVHSGQHYDERMSKKFFSDLNIPEADINLNIGSGSHAEQVGQTMIKLEKVLEKEQPDWVIVVGDVNATLASSITAKKLWIKVCHIEAGLRSGDMSMPEEINRLVTDRLSDLLLIPDLISGENLLKEGISKEKIKFVGNIMIDTLEINLSQALELSIKEILLRNSLFDDQFVRKNISNSIQKGFGIITLHRPSNVDNEHIIRSIIDFIVNEASKDMALVWPIHPRSKKQLQKFKLWHQVVRSEKVYLLHPLGYHDMLRLNLDARIMLTDSGGLQEECTVLGTPCVTLRWNTERPITLREFGGASILVGNNIDQIRIAYKALLKENRDPTRPELWDGKTAERCLKAILTYT